jgi:hypothetical protein
MRHAFPLLRQFVLAGAVLAIAVLSSSQPAPRQQVGFLPDGGFLLNSGWRVKAAGTQIPLSTLPMASVLSKDGRFLFALNGGYQPPSVSVLDTKDGRELQRIAVPDGWLGLALAPNGRTLWVGGGSKASIFEFSVSETGRLEAKRTFEIVKEADRGEHDFIGDVEVSPDGRLLYAADLYHDQILVVNPQSGIVIEHFKTGRRPYRIMFSPDGKAFFVTSCRWCGWARMRPICCGAIEPVLRRPARVPAGRRESLLRRRIRTMSMRRRYRIAGTCAWWNRSTCRRRPCIRWA